MAKARSKSPPPGEPGKPKRGAKAAGRAEPPKPAPKARGGKAPAAGARRDVRKTAAKTSPPAAASAAKSAKARAQKSPGPRAKAKAKPGAAAAAERRTDRADSTPARALPTTARGSDRPPVPAPPAPPVPVAPVSAGPVATPVPVAAARTLAPDVAAPSARPVSTARPVAAQFGDEEGWTPVEDAGPDDGDGAFDGELDDEDAEADDRSMEHPGEGPPPAAVVREEGWIPMTSAPSGATGGGRNEIPPLPDEDDVFEPIESEDEGPPREPPPGATPHDVLLSVRRGRLHVSALNAIPDEMIEALADDEGLAPAPGERRADLLRRLLEHRPPEPARPPVDVEGLLELLPEGFGFIRRAEYGYVRATSDPFVPIELVRELALMTGHWLAAKARPPRSDEKYPEVIEILGVNHEEPTAARDVAPFESLVVTHPDKRFLLETEPEQVSMRLMDLFCPLGRGQRALVVSPPRAGKTILLQGIADSLARNHPEVDIVVLLVDERPEEVTNMRRSIRGEVFASTFDQPAHRHIRLAELVLEKVKRMVEFGRHVVLLLDSLTRLGRAYNNESAEGGRLLTGGLEASALTKPKAFFGAARNIEHGGSLTIVASALVDTGSRLDQVIFEEFKGTGNMEIALSRDLAYRRLWPAIDIPKSGTRKEDLLLHPEELRRITLLRRAMAGQEAPEVLTDLLYKMDKHRTNAEFLMMVQG